MQQVILITGASSGLGKEMAGYLLRKGHRVYGTSRKPSENSVNFIMIEMDVTDEESVRLAVSKVIDAEGRIDVLINNAGMGIGGALENFSIDEAYLQMNTSFFGMVSVTRTVLPHMREMGHGKIVNISSIGGLMGLPFQGHYSAAKFAVEGYSESLSIEVRPFGVRVVVVNPGDFKTGFTANRTITAKDTMSSDYAKYFENALKVIEKDEQGGSNPKVLARTIDQIVERKNPHYRYVVGRFDQRLIARLKPFLPNCLMAWILKIHYKVG
jgi:NAD(P)-dependent dehydrogenase (short-subunit alcohol dehydrogenase family)